MVVLSAPKKKSAASIETATSSMRTEFLLRRTRMHFPLLDIADIKIRPIEKGGSDRKFYRIRCSPDQTLILVKYNLEREENRHYVEIAKFLEAHGIRAPKIYFHDATEGLIWIEDMGEQDLYSYRGDSWLVRRTFYESALDEIIKLHGLPEQGRTQRRPARSLLGRSARSPCALSVGWALSGRRPSRFSTYSQYPPNRDAKVFVGE